MGEIDYSVATSTASTALPNRFKDQRAATFDDHASTASTAVSREFIDQRAATFHGAFEADSHFDTAMSKYQSKEVSDLEETLKRYQRMAPHRADFDFDLLECTWDDVLHELERAQAASSKSDERGKKLHARAWRALGAMSDVLAPGLAALPNDLCVLQGGLAVIFSLARQRSQNRQVILRAFEDIPNVITMAYGKAESIPRDRPGSARLHAMIAELQQTLLRTLPVLIDRLNPGTFLNKALSPFRNMEIDGLLAAVRSSSERVRVCAEQVMDSIIVSTHHSACNNEKMTKDIHTITQQGGAEVGELRGRVDEILKHQQSFQATLDAISGKNSLLGFLMEYLRNPEHREGGDSPVMSPPLNGPAAPVAPRQLLALMGIHHLSALDDEHLIIRRGHSINSDAISHAATMFQTTQVQQLLRSSESGVVLVNGCGDRAQHTKISPVTYVCANLTHALRRSAGANIVLAYFCGQHSTSQDDLQGPQGLLRSLVAFLLLSLVQNKYVSDSAPIWLPAFPGEDFEELSFQKICHLFYRLIELVPRGVNVYCVVDGISYYERPIYKEDYDVMMDCFGGIIANKAINAVFKFFVTSPTICRWLPDLMPHQRVSLRNSRPRGPTRPEAYLQSAFGYPASPEGW